MRLGRDERRRLDRARVSSVAEVLEKGDVPRLDEACQLDRIIVTDDGEICILAGVTPDPELVAELNARRCLILYDDGDRSIDEGPPKSWGWVRESLS